MNRLTSVYIYIFRLEKTSTISKNPQYTTLEPPIHSIEPFILESLFLIFWWTVGDTFYPVFFIFSNHWCEIGDG